MPDANSLRALRCPNCGAPLEFAPGQSTTRCRFCDSVIENSSDDLTADDHAHVISGGPSVTSAPGVSSGPAKRYVIKMRNGQPVVLEGDNVVSDPVTRNMVNNWQSTYGAGGGSTPSLPMRTATPQRSSRAGCVVALVILALVAIIPASIYFTSPQAAAFVQQVLAGNVDQALGTASTIGSRIVLGDSGTIVPGTNDGPPEAIMLVTEYPSSGGDGEKRVVAVDTTTRKLLWQSAPLDDKLYDTPLLANGDFVFILNQQQLMAIKRTDGTLGWQATLADTVSLSLCDCLKLVGTRLAVFTDDGTLEVYDTATGRSQWQVKALQDSPRGLYVLGKRIAFIDRDADNHGLLRAFDLATGKETTAQPSCADPGDNYTNYADWTTPLLVSPAGTEFYLLFGSAEECAQRWDAQTLKMDWSTPLPKDAPFSLEGLTPVFSADTLYLSKDSSVLAFGLDQGDGRIAVSDPDYIFNVIAVHGDDLILEARRQRGTARYAIWAVNAATGQQHWTFDLGENKPMELGGIIDDDTPVWLAQPASDGLRVLRFKSASDNKSYALLQDTLNWDTGESAGQKSTPLNLDTIILSAPDWIIWKGDTLWMSLNYQLMAFDVVARKFTYQWP